MKKERRNVSIKAELFSLGAVSAMALLVPTLVSVPRGIGHKTEVNYHYDVNVYIEDDLLPCYEVTKPNEYEFIDIPYDKVYVMYHTDEWLSPDCYNILKETTYTSLLFDNEETEYELYIFVLESKGGLE